MKGSLQDILESGQQVGIDFNSVQFLSEVISNYKNILKNIISEVSDAFYSLYAIHASADQAEHLTEEEEDARIAC